MRTLWTQTLILLIAAGLFLHQIEVESVWFDEGWSAYAASQSSVVAAANADTTNPPLYYILIYLSAIFTGQTEFGLRWLSYALGMLTVAVAGRLGVQLGGRRAGTFAALTATLSGPLLWASQEMRMYTLLAVLMGVVLVAWEKLRTRPNRAAWIALVLAELAILYTHNTGPVVIIWLNGATLLAWVIGRKPRLLHWIISQAIVLAAWSPYFITRFLLLTDANSALVRRTPLSVELWAGLWLAPWEAVTTSPYGWLTIVTIPAALLTLTALRYERGRWLWLHLLILVGGLWLALNLLGNELHGRYLVMLVPLVAGLVTVGIAGLPRPLRWVSAIYLAGLCALNINLLSNPVYRNDDARAMAQHYAETLTNNDTVLAWSYADRYELAYYWDRLNVDAGRVTLPEGADMDVVRPLLPTDGDISLNVWYTQRADYRGMMNCLLSHGATQAPDEYQVSGMATLTYPNPLLIAPDSEAHNAQFEIGTVERIGSLPSNFQANQSLCLPVSVRLDAPTTDELSAAVVVRNHLGITVTQVSSVFATADGRTSIDNTVGEALTAYPVIDLPAGTPPGAYTVELRLFDSVTLSGYDQIIDGSPAGKSLLVGEWQILPGAVWTDVPQSTDTLSLDIVQLSKNTARNGDTLDIRLDWQASSSATALPVATLRAVDGSWSVTVPTTQVEYDNLVTEWRRVQIPLDASAGEAVLTIEGFQQSAALQIEQLLIVTEPPPIDNRTNAVFPDVGTILGYNISVDGAVVTVDLVWQVADSLQIEGDYTVFVQFLDGNGVLVVQSDARPAMGERPTTSWRPGEIIIDRHSFTFEEPPSVDDLKLIAGLYDDPFTRLRAADGEDYVVLFNPPSVD